MWAPWAVWYRDRAGQQKRGQTIKGLGGFESTAKSGFAKDSSGCYLLSWNKP